MKIETKYNIGDRVWIVYEHKEEVRVYSTEILEINYSKDGINYYMNDDSCEEFTEESLIPYSDTTAFINKIIKLDNKITEKIKTKENKDD